MDDETGSGTMAGEAPAEGEPAGAAVTSAGEAPGDGHHPEHAAHGEHHHDIDAHGEPDGRAAAGHAAGHPQPGHATNAHHGEHGGHRGEHEEEEHESLRAALKERLVQIENMETSSKLLLFTAIAILVASAVLVGLRNVSFPSIVGDDSDDGLSNIPDIVLVVCLVGFAGAWALLVGAACRAGWLLRVLVVGTFGWILWDSKDVVTETTTPVTIICCALLAVVAALAIGTWFPERHVRAATDRAAAVAALPKTWRTLRHYVTPVIFLLLLGVLTATWIGSVLVDQKEYFTTSFSFILSNHQYVLIPLLVLAGSDFGEWGDFAVGRVVKRVAGASRAWLLAGVTFVAAGLILFDGIRIARSDDAYGTLESELILGACVILAVPLLMLVAKPSGRWSAKVPFLAVAAVAIIDSVSGFITEAHLSDSDPDIGDKITAISAITWSVAAAVCIVVLLARRGKLRGDLVASAIFVILVGVTETLQALPEVGEVIHPFGLNADNASGLGMEGIKAVAAAATIALLLYAVAARKVEAWVRPISLTLVALVSIEFLTWVDSLFGATLNETEKTSLLAGVVVVIALAWEFGTSGEVVTNPDTRRFTRSTRLYFYMGYVLLVAISVLYYGDLHAIKNGALIESQFDSEEWVREGILFLGLPLVMAMYVGGIQRWRHRGDKELAESPARAHEPEPAALPDGVAVEPA